jgi:hypothetical protein
MDVLDSMDGGQPLNCAWDLLRRCDCVRAVCFDLARTAFCLVHDASTLCHIEQYRRRLANEIFGVARACVGGLGGGATEHGPSHVRSPAVCYAMHGLVCSELS